MLQVYLTSWISTVVHWVEKVSDILQNALETEMFEFSFTFANGRTPVRRASAMDYDSLSAFEHFPRCAQSTDYFVFSMYNVNLMQILNIPYVEHTGSVGNRMSINKKCTLHPPLFE